MFLLKRNRSGRLLGLVAVLTVFAVLTVSLSSPAEARRARAHPTARHARTAYAGAATDAAKDAALIIDGTTGRVIYARNENELRHPASLTKMMTLYLLFDALKRGQISLNSTIPISAHAAAQKPTKLRMRPGDSINVELAIKAVVVWSANDVAVAIGEALGGTEGHFAEMMTAKARQIGMRNTFYHNASGLPDNLQITTATDLSLLARHLINDFPQYYHYFATPSFSYRGGEYVTHDNLLARYRGTDGIKTGYTGASGFNLVSSVVRDNVHLIGVVMGGITAAKRDREMMRLLDLAYGQVGQNPALVARANVTWQTAQAAPAPVPTFNPNAYSLPASQASDGDDEDTAERRADADDIARSRQAQQPATITLKPPHPTVVAVTAPAKVPVPTKKPEMVAAAIAQHPQPTARPAAPVQVAAVAPAKTASPKPAIRPAFQGEGDISDTPSLHVPTSQHDWTIQIGAFADLKLAQTHLAAYAEKSMDVLGQARRIVVPFQSVDGHTIYRARFGPFAEREARQICARLTERGQTCFATISTR